MRTQRHLFHTWASSHSPLSFAEWSRQRDRRLADQDDALAGLDVIREPIRLSVAIGIVLVCALVTGGLIVWGVLRWGMR